MWVLVAETDMTGLWSVPKRQRYLPMLAGPVIDLVSASLLTLLKGSRHQGWITLPAVVEEVGLAMVIVYLMRLLWQCFFFVRTDFYYVVAAAFRPHSNRCGIRKPTSATSGGGSSCAFRRATGRTSRPGQQRVIRAYFWVWLLGRGLAFWGLFFVTLPVAGRYLRDSLAALTGGFSGGHYAYLDALFVVVFYLFPLGLGMGLWIHGMIKQRRIPREREPRASAA